MKRSPRTPRCLAGAAALLQACAGVRPRPESPAAAPLQFAPLVVEASPYAELAGKNDEDLFAVGSSAFAAGEFRRAADAFARICDVFPESKRRAAALYDAGLSFERLEEWRLALERFRVLEAEYQGKDADEAAFRVAECQYHLGELGAARKVLEGLAARTDLDPGEHVRALTQRGVVELEAGDPAAAEKTLRLAVSAHEGAQDRERLDDYYPSQAQYYLGEVFRSYFQSIQLDPAKQGEAKLAQDLEYKAEMLLSAQGHYLRAVRMGNSDWAVASGYRIGELYDALYAALTEAPLPPELDDEQARAYREELRKKVRILITKAIAIYERTLDAAHRAGVTNRFVDQTQASLERMKKILLGPNAGAPSSEPAQVPDADPDA